MTKRIELVEGAIFNKLKVLRFYGRDKNSHALYECECICGTIKIIRGSCIKNNAVKSCGCIRKEVQRNRDNTVYSKPKYIASINSLYASYKVNAHRRNYTFDMTLDQFITLISQNCYYCNVPPKQHNNNKKYNGNMKYNGIDRVNNDLGYTVENCVSCCKICNFMKGKLTQQEFIAHCKRIVNNVQKT